jgi:hypothetical protein
MLKARDEWREGELAKLNSQTARDLISALLVEQVRCGRRRWQGSGGRRRRTRGEPPLYEAIARKERARREPACVREPLARPKRSRTCSSWRRSWRSCNGSATYPRSRTRWRKRRRRG